MRSACDLRPGRSRLACVKRSVDNSASGSTVKRCYVCSLSERRTKETIHNGLLLLRVRYGLPYSELPDCSSSELSRFLSFLLQQGKERASVVFPRRQRRGEDGLCSLQRLCRRDRWALAHGVSSIKRNLPSGCSRHTPSVRSSWERNALSQPPPSSPEYLDHVRRVSARVFTSGWDRNYHDFVGRHVPNPTSRFPRKSRADRLWARRRGEFFNSATKESELCGFFFARYKEVMSAGKKRPLLIYDERCELLAPLHSMVYSRLCREDWLLCGPPTKERLASVCVNNYQTSVDLVAATDNLSHDVAKVLLDTLFFTSVKIPRSVRLLAHASLAPVFESESGEYRTVSHGQMMGSYLSFPLLCLQSYCAASWAARFDPAARFLVNGDDAVISASRYVTVRDYPPGYRLNDDKTIRAENVCEVNSTCFLRSSGKWREVRHIRRGGATADFPGMMHMAKAVCSDQGMVDAFQRCRIGRRWGFLPSQLGHTGYPAYKREQSLRVRRTWTALPEPVVDCSFPEELVRITGRDPTPVEAEALRVVFWEHGRMGGLKRDEFSPSCGKVRRTYGYRQQKRYSRLSYVSSGLKLSFKLRLKRGWFVVPATFRSDEEMRGVSEYAAFVADWDAGFIRLHPLDTDG
jgi:hypothetical protein